MFEILTAVGITSERCEHIRERVEEFRRAWDLERRPCRCAGPGRPRARVTEANFFNEEARRIPLGAFASPTSSRNQDELRGSFFLENVIGSKTRDASLLISSTDSHGACLAAGPAPHLRGMPAPHGPGALTPAHGGAVRVQLPAFLDGSSLLWPALGAASLRSAMAGLTGASSAQPAPDAAAFQTIAMAGRGPVSVPVLTDEEMVARARKRARDPDSGGGGAEAVVQETGAAAGPVNKASLAHLLS